MKSALKSCSLLIFIFFILGGCATNRGIVTLQVPESKMSPQTNGKSIFIKSVTDNRVFEEKPNSPEIPSLGFGGTNAASIETKKRAIARKRNSYGKALGDILLDQNQTVETIIADSLKKSFYDLGYKILFDKANLEKDTIIIDVSIEKFWSWMNPGFWAITLSSEIGTKIIFTNYNSEPKEIYVKSEGSYQVASGGNWIEIMNKSLQAYNSKVKDSFNL
jgi:hypothetical protein